MSKIQIVAMLCSLLCIGAISSKAEAKCHISFGINANFHPAPRPCYRERPCRPMVHRHIVRRSSPYVIHEEVIIDEGAYYFR